MCIAYDYIEEESILSHVFLELGSLSCQHALVARCRPNIKILIFSLVQSKIELFFPFKRKGGEGNILSHSYAGKNVHKRGAAILREISKRKCSPRNLSTLLCSAYQCCSDVCNLPRGYGANYCEQWRHARRTAMPRARILLTRSLSMLTRTGTRVILW